MRNLSNQLKNRVMDQRKLIAYGFQKQIDDYCYQTILENTFQMWVVFSKKEQYAKLIDIESQEEYILVDIENRIGSFSSKIKDSYEQKLEDIIDSCTNPIIENHQLEQIVHYIQNKYQNSIEYLWKNSPENGIWRNTMNQKWYGILMKIEESKLGISSNKVIEVLNLKYQSEQIQDIIDNQTIFPGYHMNKKHWITICLNGNIENEKLFALIDNSYQLSQK